LSAREIFPAGYDGVAEAEEADAAVHPLITPGPGEEPPHSQAARYRASMSTGRATAGRTAPAETKKRGAKGKVASGELRRVI
jgi:hypothetical protein